MSVSIIIPYVRYEGMKRCVDAIIENAGYHDYELVVEEDTNRIGAPLMVHNLLQKCKFDLIMFLADDTEPQKDFLLHAVNCINKFDDKVGLVCLNDGKWDGKLATHFLIHKKLISMIGGYIFNPVYFHNFCDQELTCRSKELHKYKYCEEAKIIHHNPAVNPNILTDEFYERTYNKSKYLKDKMTFLRRKENTWN
jgi:GT2 family glycosyltransferase